MKERDQSIQSSSNIRQTINLIGYQMQICDPVEHVEYDVKSRERPLREVVDFINDLERKRFKRKCYIKKFTSAGSPFLSVFLAIAALTAMR